MSNVQVDFYRDCHHANAFLCADGSFNLGLPAISWPGPQRGRLYLTSAVRSGTGNITCKKPGHILHEGTSSGVKGYDAGEECGEIKRVDRKHPKHPM